MLYEVITIYSPVADDATAYKVLVTNTTTNCSTESGTDAVVYNVITSYSIHYTKLYEECVNVPVRLGLKQVL